jgi:nucleoside triphosphate pyrophosphatase
LTALDPRLVLASASPRRARILRSLGVTFRVVVTNVDETLLEGEAAAAAAERLARAKADRALASESLPVVAADTLVVCNGDILGKPESPAAAADMLRRLAGRRHDVLTGLCVGLGTTRRSAVERTAVTFAEMSEAEIGWYVETGEPLDKAGAYHVDGRGALFVVAIDGSPSNVAGLPVRLLLRLARETGLDLGPS